MPMDKSTPQKELNSEKLQEICRKYDVKKLYLFGSAVSGDLTEGSDLDFIVEFDGQGYDGAFDQFMNFKNELERHFNRKVDVYHQKKFRNPIFQREVDRTKELLYAA